MTILYPQLKNFIQNDPLSDWFEVMNQYYHCYERVEETTFELNLKENKYQYKQDFFSFLKQYQTHFENDLDHHQMKQRFESKVKGIFIDCYLYHQKYDILLKPDLIIHRDIFKEIFKEVTIHNLPEYIVCDILYQTVHFNSDQTDILNNDNLYYHKCKLYLCSQCIDKSSQTGYLFAKEYKHKEKSLRKKESIGYFQFDTEMIHKIKEALTWIDNLYEFYNEWIIYPKPTIKELYPNMNNNESDWENEKYKLATEIKEITSVWNISYNERCDFLEKGIECWDDDKLLKNLKESKKRNIQERMIHMNKNTDILLYPRKNISSTFQEILSLKNDIYFDVESFLSFDEKQELLNDELNKRDPVLGILGFIHNGKYWNYTMNDFSLTEEKKIVTRFIDHLHKINNSKLINIYHWGHAEFNYLKYIQDKYPEIILPEYRLINVLDFFRTEPIIVQGVFKFGLKYIGEALYKNKLIKPTWGINDNGLDTMIEFKDVCKNNTKKIPLKRYSQIVDIIDYNRIDCQVLYEIVDLMKKTYL